MSLHRPGAGPLCWAVAITWASSLVTSSCGDTSWPRRHLSSRCLSQKHSPLLVPPACQVLWGTQAGVWSVRSHGWEGLSCDSILCKQPQSCRRERAGTPLEPGDRQHHTSGGLRGGEQLRRTGFWGLLERTCVSSCVSPCVYVSLSLCVLMCPCPFARMFVFLCICSVSPCSMHPHGYKRVSLCDVLCMLWCAAAVVGEWLSLWGAPPHPSGEHLLEGTLMSPQGVPCQSRCHLPGLSPALLLPLHHVIRAQPLPFSEPQFP